MRLLAKTVVYQKALTAAQDPALETRISRFAKDALQSDPEFRAISSDAHDNILARLTPNG